MNKTDNMEVSRSIRRIDVYGSDIAIFYFVYSLDGSIPFTGIVAICPDVFFHSELLIGTVPTDYSIISKICSQCLLPLLQYIFPE